MELQHFVFKINNLTFIYINIFSKENIYQKLYINHEDLLFSKFKQKITVKQCFIGKILRQHCVKDTILLQNMLKIWKHFDINCFLLVCVIKCETMKILNFWNFSTLSRENCMAKGKSEGKIVFGTPIHSKICNHFELFLKKVFFCWPV